MIALDSEVTGIDMRHGAKPYFVTTCNEKDEIECWQWDVDPYTREPIGWEGEIHDIIDRVENADTVIMQNGKFDVTALSTLNDWFLHNFPWSKTRDTLIAGHLLGSGYKHDLTSMVTQYLSTQQNPIDIEPLETRLEEICTKARRYAQRKLPEWAIAEQGRKDMPSAKEKCWKMDMWLPRAMFLELGNEAIVAIEKGNRKHGWDTALAEYSNADSFATVHLWRAMERMIKERDLWEIFCTRMKLIPIALEMECRGVTLSKARMKQLRDEYETESKKAETICVSIAEGYGFKIKMPKSGNSDSIREFAFDVLKLPPHKESKKTGDPSLDKEVLQHYVDTLPARSPELLFMQNLMAKRKRDTALSYMSSYERYWIPLNIVNDKGERLWCRLNPNLNITGTAHLRWSSSNPNEQNISKQEGFNLRYMFGPAPGWEWWSLDAQNIELRIPAFEAGEKDLMDVFLKPKESPYYGSYHLVVFDALYPDIFKRHGKAVKDLFESTLYQWVKNGNFSILYGAQEAQADATYHLAGAFKKIRHRFPKIAGLSDKQIAIANRTGGVETIPDRSVNPRRGYPIMCARGDYGKVRPTLPLNYHVSGTAMQWMAKAMIRCHEKIVEWRATGFDSYMPMQVHDEIVFALPKYGDPTKNPDVSNLPRINVLKGLMEKGGDDIGLPTPVAVEYNPISWDCGIKF